MRDIRLHTSLFILISLTLGKIALTKDPWINSYIESPREINYDYLDIILYILWLIGPPLFFLYEYIYIFGKDPSNRLDKAQVDDLKYTQELGSKIWTALSVCFGVLLLVKYGLKL